MFNRRFFYDMTGGGAGDAPLKVVQGTALSQVSGSTQVAVTVTVPGVSEILFRGMRVKRRYKLR